MRVFTFIKFEERKSNGSVMNRIVSHALGKKRLIGKSLELLIERSSKHIFQSLEISHLYNIDSVILNKIPHAWCQFNFWFSSSEFSKAKDVSLYFSDAMATFFLIWDRYALPKFEEILIREKLFLLMDTYAHCVRRVKSSCNLSKLPSIIFSMNFSNQL